MGSPAKELIEIQRTRRIWLYCVYSRRGHGGEDTAKRAGRLTLNPIRLIGRLDMAIDREISDINNVLEKIWRN